jgi:hypothetical protein
MAALAKGTVEPLDDGRGSRVSLALAFEPRGLGRFFLTLVVGRQAREHLPRNTRQLKQRLEQRSASANVHVT